MRMLKLLRGKDYLALKSNNTGQRYEINIIVDTAIFPELSATKAAAGSVSSVVESSSVMSTIE